MLLNILNACPDPSGGSQLSVQLINVQVLLPYSFLV
jgi:hypothetical protein